MPSFSISEAAFAGLGLFGRHPLAAMVWAGLGVVFLGLLLILFGPAVAGTIATLIARGHGGGANSLQAVFGLIGAALGFLLILALGSAVLGAIVSCAVYRAVLEPEDSGLLYLRLGPSELSLLLVNFVQGLVISGVQALITIPLGILTVISGGGHGDVSSLAIGGLLRLVSYGVVIWLYLRFSMAGPLTFRDRRFRLFESWAMTRGQGWRLLGVAALVGVTGFGIYLVLSMVGFAGAFAIVGSLGLGDSLKSLAVQPPSAWVSLLAPILEWVLLLFWVGGAILTPLTLAPWAVVFKRLNPGESLAETFA
jgi:hypothetical protein